MHPNYQLNKNQILINYATAHTEFCLYSLCRKYYKYYSYAKR